MVKSYEGFELDSTFGVIASNSNISWLPPLSSASHTSAGRVVSAGLEEVLIWDIKTGTQVSKWRDSKGNREITSIAQVENGEMIATGYSDGSIKIWDSRSGTELINFSGHKNAITCLSFDKSGTRLASGSRDSNIIVWDLVSEEGLYRLRSHRDQITSIVFLSAKLDKNTGDEGENDMTDIDINVDEAENKWLLSTSKDGLVKLWDLDTQHCVETHVSHRGECWSLGVSPNETLAITSGNDKELKAWALFLGDDVEDGNRVVELGALQKQSVDKALKVLFHPFSPFFAIQNNDKTVEIWRARTADEVRKSVARKIKRRREKGVNEDDLAKITEEDVTERFVQFAFIRTPAKVKSFDWASTTTGTFKKESLQLIIALNNNSIEYYNIDLPDSYKKNEATPDFSRQFAIDLLGHRTDIRAISVSSDDKMVATASNGSLKIWNIRTTSCLRTFECGYALCTSFLPGDALLVVGTKNGDIELFDVASSTLLETIPAHEGAVWSLDVSTDGKTLVTGGADKTVKFWEFKIVEEEVIGTSRTMPRMKLKNTKALQLTDDVLAVKLSPCGKFIAASLLDNTVKVFFVDTLKFYLNLYGHKLPVLSLDISFDSKLLVTSSADKNIKLWGLDFGDCHKSIFAHQDSIMNVVFEKDSHHFFSASKDKLIKYWDGDKFENIQKLEGHHSEVWCIAVAHNGEFLISAAHDKSIRVWQRSDEPIFLEELREKELEELYEATLTSSLEGDDDGLFRSRKEGEDAEENEESHVERVGKQTIETLKAGEKVIEALEIGDKDLDLMAAWKQGKLTNPKLALPARDPRLAFMNISAEDFVFSVLEKIKAAQLEDALFVLPFNQVTAMLRFIEIWVKNPKNIGLICRVLFFLIKVHQKQIVANKIMKPMLENVKEFLRLNLKNQHQEIGYNMSGLKFIKQNWDTHHKKDFIDEKEFKADAEKTTQKRAFTTFA
ncbi:WD40 repeat-like protein [Nadsonia fulvescens var. elongata DSM 6958]|uniref:WD40 repeat-like protein n=1 Tax=Nadsonia fulvescens var. elongata DSM 6958 TaxID=857566 RepID=A0A1E3PCQ7_9ASCO|nr:WD40 repeat-like protein [Nadsonia fulvescens var. elongata DSM 6958]